MHHAVEDDIQRLPAFFLVFVSSDDISIDVDDMDIS
jgi:hypothetical protein